MPMIQQKNIQLLLVKYTIIIKKIWVQSVTGKPDRLNTFCTNQYLIILFYILCV